MRISDWSSDVCSSDLLRHCRFFWTKLNIVEGKEEFGKTPVWMIDITRAKACIHQNQSRVAFDQKAMANQMAEWPIRCPVEETAADGTACPTTQVMNTHGSAHMDTGSRRPHGCMHEPKPPSRSGDRKSTRLNSSH